MVHINWLIKLGNLNIKQRTNNNNNNNNDNNNNKNQTRKDWKFPQEISPRPGNTGLMSREG